MADQPNPPKRAKIENLNEPSTSTNQPGKQTDKNSTQLLPLENSIEEPNHILEKGLFDLLPYEIIEMIFKFCSLNGLAELSKTCKAMKELTEYDFLHKKQNGWVSLELGKNGRIRRWGNCEKYEARFRPLINQIYLIIHTIKSIKKLFEFINGICTPSIRRLRMDFRMHHYSSLQYEYIEIIGSQLEHLEDLILWRPPSIYGVLNYCKNLRTLYIAREWNTDARIDNWSNIVLPKLQSFTLVDERRRVEIDLMNLLINAPELKTIALNNLTAIRRFLNSDFCVQIADFWFRESRDLLMLLGDFERNSNQHQIDTIHLMVDAFIDQNHFSFIFDCLANFKNVKSFHFMFPIEYYFNFPDATMFANMPMQLYLETLCIRFSYCTSMEFVEHLVKLTPNLQELHISDYSLEFNTASTPKQLLMPIVGQFGNLKRFSFEFRFPPSYQGNNTFISNDDIVEMNFERAKLIEPSFLEVRTKNIHIIDTKLDKISIMNSEHPICLTCSMFETYDCFSLDYVPQRRL